MPIKQLGKRIAPHWLGSFHRQAATIAEHRSWRDASSYSAVNIYHRTMHYTQVIIFINVINTTAILYLVFCLAGLFSQISLQVRIGMIYEKQTFGDCSCKIFDRLDTLPVAQTTLSNHWRNKLIFKKKF